MSRSNRLRTDRVTLNSTPTPPPTIQQPTRLPGPQVVQDSVDLSFDNLSNSQLPGEGQAVLRSYGKEASLKAMWSKIKATAPQLGAGETTLKAHYYKDQDWSNFRLTGTQHTEHGEFSVTNRYNRPTEGKLRQSQDMDFTVKGEFRDEMMPAVLREHWEKSGSQSPQSATKAVESLMPTDGELTKTQVYAGNVNDEKPYNSLSWTRKTESGIEVRYSHNDNRSRAQMELTPEQFESGSLPKALSAQLKEFGLSKGLFDTILSGTGLEASKYRLGIAEEDGRKSLTLGLTLSDGTKDVGAMDRRFTDKVEDGKSVREVYHGGFRLDEEFQGKGYGKKLLANSFKMYKKAGVDEVRLTASMTVGGYAWGRYGFQLVEDEDNSKRLNEQVQGRLAELSLDKPTQGVVESLLKSDKPKRIWALADLDKKVVRDGKETKLGKALLLGNSWSGRFDMHDAASQKRLNHYLSQ